MKENSFWDKLKEDLNNLDLTEEAKELVNKKMIELANQKLNIMVTGATGSGKSSTINALFGYEVAKVGDGTDPETMIIDRYEISNITLWDTPGLGDSPDMDKVHAEKIVELLNRKDANGIAIIDLVLVILDGSIKDMGTSYELINQVIIPNISDKNRILVAINQCDLGLKGRGWDKEKNVPMDSLIEFMEERVKSVKNRIFEATAVEVNPIYYSALHKYNISKLLCYIIKSTPNEKRMIYVDNINKDPDVWKRNDTLIDYNLEIQKDVKFSLTKALDASAKGAVAGATVGALVPIIGPVIGATIGAALGFIGGLFNR
jgi:hypothetical protein